MIQDAFLPPADIQRFQQRSMIAGFVGLMLCGVGVFTSPDQFFRSYLLAYVFWIGITLGSLAIVMLHHLSGGAWGIVIRRLLEAGTRTLPVMTVMFLPLVLGLTHLYEWARPEVVQADKILQKKALYLNVPFFILRNVVYFMAWLTLVYFINKWSRQQDEIPQASLSGRPETLSGPGLVVFGATVTFASFDWVMSLEPHWYSTVFGLSFMVGQVLSAFAFAIMVAVLLSRQKPMAEVLQPSHFQDLGKLTLAFVMLWAYLSFSQFLIVWSGNLPEETPYYLKRLTGGWQWIQLSLILFHFTLPFILLLSRALKREGNRLWKVAALVLVMRFVDLYLLISPTGHDSRFQFHWLDLAALIGIGGVWLSFFTQQLQKRPVLPIHDPEFAEAIESGH